MFTVLLNIYSIVLRMFQGGLEHGWAFTPQSVLFRHGVTIVPNVPKRAIHVPNCSNVPNVPNVPKG